MVQADKTVFISYRRSTSKHLAGRIFDHLRSHRYDVFLDVNTIDSGAFDTIILNQIAARAHFVVLLTPGALERCANEGDWLRREIEESLRLKRNIVPVIEEGFDFERETAYLPAAWRVAFKRLNGLPLSYFYFEASMQTLRERFLKQPVYGVEIKPTPAAERAEVQERIKKAELAVRVTDEPQGEVKKPVEQAGSVSTAKAADVARDGEAQRPVPTPAPSKSSSSMLWLIGFFGGVIAIMIGGGALVANSGINLDVGGLVLLIVIIAYIILYIVFVRDK
jgi:hypothetical protein